MSIDKEYTISIDDTVQLSYTNRKEALEDFDNLGDMLLAGETITLWHKEQQLSQYKKVQ